MSVSTINSDASSIAALMWRQRQDKDTAATATNSTTSTSPAKASSVQPSTVVMQVLTSGGQRQVTGLSALNGSVVQTAGTTSDGTGNAAPSNLHSDLASLLQAVQNGVAQTSGG
jgi:hypothetical protein